MSRGTLSPDLHALKKPSPYKGYNNSIRPGGGGGEGSETRMTKRTAVNQKPLTL